LNSSIKADLSHKETKFEGYYVPDPTGSAMIEGQVFLHLVTAEWILESCGNYLRVSGTKSWRTNADLGFEG
jgi:hypothetical protein